MYSVRIGRVESVVNCVYNVIKMYLFNHFTTIYRYIMHVNYDKSMNTDFLGWLERKDVTDYRVRRSYHDIFEL